MEKYLDVIRRVLELSKTVFVGLTFVQANLNAGEFEKMKSMLSDVIAGIYKIQESISPFLLELPSNEIAPLSNELKNSLDGIVSAYEQKEVNQVRSKLEGDLLPVFQEWQKELIRCFGPYVLFN